MLFGEIPDGGARALYGDRGRRRRAGRLDPVAVVDRLEEGLLVEHGVGGGPTSLTPGMPSPSGSSLGSKSPGDGRFDSGGVREMQERRMKRGVPVGPSTDAA